MTFKKMRQNSMLKAMHTFLPNGYPHSVSENYIKFVSVSNVGAIMFTAMGFLST
jgi:hypothetical protein